MKASTVLECFEMGASRNNGNNSAYGMRSYSVIDENNIDVTPKLIDSQKNISQEYIDKYINNEKEEQIIDRNNEIEIQAKYRKKMRNMIEKNIYKYKCNSKGQPIRGKYVWFTYNTIRKQFQDFGRGLRTIGQKKNDNICIFSNNCIEWNIASFGSMSQSIIVVPQYSTLGILAVEYIITSTESKALIISLNNTKIILELLNKIKSCIKYIIIIDTLSIIDSYGNILDMIDDEFIDECKRYDIIVLGYNDILQLGKKYEKTIELQDIKPSDLACIIYTSGTIDIPKGVKLTHGNIVAPVASVAMEYQYIDMPNNPTYLSYLPLAHAFEHAGQYFSMCWGSKIAYSQGNITYLIDDLQESSPHILPSVPRVFLRMYQNIWKTINEMPLLKRLFIRRAFHYQLLRHHHKAPYDKTYDKLVFSVIRKLIGQNNLKFVIVGSAPCPNYQYEFMRVITNSCILQGYGMTECAAGSIVTLEKDIHSYTIGVPLSCNYIRLQDIPDMEYYTTDKPSPRGEILIYGTNVTEGYYKNDEENSSLFYYDEQNTKWLRTGDIGKQNPNGTISIIGRIKNIIKLSQGEYVSLEKIEDEYSKSNMINQIWCYANSFKPILVAVIVLDWYTIYTISIANNWWPDMTIKPSNDKIADDNILKMIKIVGRKYYNQFKTIVEIELKNYEKNLCGFEKIRNFYLEFNMNSLGMAFTEENHTMTPTMKKKRMAITIQYRSVLISLFEESGDPLLVTEI